MLCMCYFLKTKWKSNPLIFQGYENTFFPLLIIWVTIWSSFYFLEMFGTVSRQFSLKTQLCRGWGMKEAQQYSQREMEIVIMWASATGIINMEPREEGWKAANCILWKHSHISQRNVHFVTVFPWLACKPPLLPPACCSAEGGGRVAGRGAGGSPIRSSWTAALPCAALLWICRDHCEAQMKSVALSSWLFQCLHKTF